MYFPKPPVTEILLWTNQNPSTAFANQTISIQDVEKYPWLIIKAKCQTALSAYGYIKIKNTPNATQTMIVIDEADAGVFIRKVIPVSNGVEFGKGVVLGQVVDNSACIPCEIYGSNV